MGIPVSNLPAMAKRGAEADASRGAPLMPGDYKCSFVKAEMAKTKAKDDKAVLEFESKAAPRKLKPSFNFLKACEWQADEFVFWMQRLGVDLTKIKKETDWNRSFLDLQDLADTGTPCRAIIKVWYSDDDMEDGAPKKGVYANYELRQVVNGLNGAKEETPEDLDFVEASEEAPEDDDSAKEADAAKLKAEKAAATKAAKAKKAKAEKEAADRLQQEKDAADAATPPTETEPVEPPADPLAGADGGDDW